MKTETIEIDPEDGLRIYEDIFGIDDGIEGFGDFMHKYFRPIYHLFMHYIPNLRFKGKAHIQRLARRNHLSDSDNWNACYSMAPGILKRLRAFRDFSQQHGHGYPSYFSEWGYEGCTDKYGGLGITRDKYEQAKARGVYGGGEMKGWHDALNEMIFGFEYHLYSDGTDKQRDSFFRRWSLSDPYRETEENLSWSYIYDTEDRSRMFCGRERHDEIQRDSEGLYGGYHILGKSRTYINSEEVRILAERAQKGMELFGKFYWNIWD
ncbi:MAG: hypothetical protein PQJ50_02510 [Spirochaetales bacterium]|nr:hypothetical protein [Spirochaetales bacterium]